MQLQEAKCSHPLEPGQLWRLEHGYLYIVELGKRLIYYRMLRQPDQRAAVTRMIALESLLNYLSQSEAELLPNPAQVCAVTQQRPITTSGLRVG